MAVMAVMVAVGVWQADGGGSGVAASGWGSFNQDPSVGNDNQVALMGGGTVRGVRLATTSTVRSNWKRRRRREVGEPKYVC